MRAVARVTALSLVAAIIGVGGALATGPGGTIERTTLSTSLLDRTGMINTDRIKFQSKDTAKVVFQRAVYKTGAVAADSGWHLHPGIVFVAVSGDPGAEVTRYVGCTAKAYHPGDTFIESGEQPVGKIANTGTADVTLHVMYVVPKDDALSDATVAAPAC